MTTLKRIVASTVLTLTIVVPLYAGDVHFPANTAPPPPPATCSDCDTQDDVQTSDATSSTSELAVDLLLALLSLF